MVEATEENLLDNLLLAALGSEESDKTKNTKENPATNLNEDEYFLSKIAANDLKVLQGPSTSGIRNKENKIIYSNNYEAKSKLNKRSSIHSGDTDSSDDEQKRDFQNRKYNDYGNEIRHLLSDLQSNTTDSDLQSNTSDSFNTVSTWKTKRALVADKANIAKPVQENTQEYILTDPFFGIRISKPLISSATLADRMSGRTAISMARIKSYISLKPTEDWVIAGAIVEKSLVKTSQNGNNYIIFTLSDLKTELRSVSVFLFKNAYKELWKTTVGTVIGVLNPSILENRDGSKQEATLSVDNNQRVMILGKSKDFGYCKSMRKDGKRCTSFVNTNNCEYCVYHVRQAYQQCSRRSELQAKFAGGGLTALRNKVLGKNEVFYAGKSYMAIPAKSNKKLVEKDAKTLQALKNSGTVTLSSVKQSELKPRRGSATSFDVSRAQRLKDLELLKKLNGSSDITSGLEDKTNFDPTAISSGISLDESKKKALDVISKLKSTKQKAFLENKVDFNPNSVCSEITLDESKKLALNVISKLKHSKKTVISQKNCAEDKVDFDTKSISSEVSLDISSKTDSDVISQHKKANKLEKSILKGSSIEDKVALQPELISLDESKSKHKSRSDGRKNILQRSVENIVDSNPENSSTVLLNESESSASCSVSKRKNIRKEKKLQIHASSKKAVKYISDIFEETSSSFQEPSTSGNKTSALSEKLKNLNFVPKLSNPNNYKNDLDLEITLDEYEEVEEPGNINTQKNKNSAKSMEPKNNCVITELIEISPNKSKLLEKPTTSSLKNTEINLTKAVPRRSMNAAKQNALKWVQKNGPISKNNPTGVKKSGVKRFLNETEDTDKKKPKLDEKVVISDRFKKIMALTSKHTDLLENYDNEQQEKYFSKLEMKEKLEEKMLSTFKVDCKAVRCLTCKYTNFSAADRCKEERHVLKVFSAVKRFFKCGDCGNRTVSLEIVPLFSCKNCNSSKWERTTMMKEKKPQIGEALSIRGGEQKFINSHIADANINLLIPAD